MKSLFISLISIVSFFIMAPITAQETKDIRLKDILATETVAASSLSKKNLTTKADIVDATYVEIPEDKFNRGQPQSSMKGYLTAARANDFERAAHYLDFRNLNKSTLAVGKEELARQLYVVLNRTLWVDLQNISMSPLGKLKEAQPRYRDFVGQISTKMGNINILLQRIPREKDKVKIWKISNATVEKIPLLSQEYAYTPFGEWLSKNLPSMTFVDVMLWQWVYYILMLVMYFIIAKIITWFVSRIAKKIWPSILIETQQFIEKPLALLLTVILTRTFFAEENLTLAAQAVGQGATLLTLAWIWLAFRAVDLLKVKLADYFISQDKPLAVYLLRPAGTVIKSLVTLCAVLIWFENLGFSATTIVAGLGIGGLAIALAAQKTVENIIGAITLYTSAPVKIGDFCRLGTQYGVVEEIGLRATRIRTLDRTVLHIANALFVDMQIENYSERERIAFRPKLFLSVDCKKSNISALLKDVEKLLIAHQKISITPLRVHFKQFTTLGLALDILSYVETTNFEEYLNIINELNLDILALIEQHDCSLAVISQRTAHQLEMHL